MKTFTYSFDLCLIHTIGQLLVLMDHKIKFDLAVIRLLQEILLKTSFPIYLETFIALRCCG